MKKIAPQLQAYVKGMRAYTEYGIACKAQLEALLGLARAAQNWRPHNGGPSTECSPGCEGCRLDRALAVLDRVSGSAKNPRRRP